ncbi:MAG: chlorohydrolase [Planctomycetaceae bacterium]|nr:chlorohydrolase [Planctomycetaceae bacterium]
MPSYRVTARWIFPSNTEPIENGTLEIQDSVVTDISAACDPEATALGNVALIPALVNAHTHLEFSDLKSPLLPATPFDDWIRTLVAYRMSRATNVKEIVADGLRESHGSGVAAVGEIATDGWSAEPFAQTPLHSVIFREQIGLSEPRVSEQLRIAREHLQQPQISTRAIFGLSPHAPFSVHPDLFANLVDLAKQHSAPVAFHLAETRDELELLEYGTGRLVQMMKSLGTWNATAFRSGVRPLDYLQTLSKLDCALVIHGNYLDDEEIEFLAKHPQLTVVYCPRTHQFFEHSEHPWLRMLERGVSLALGTDGRGSNPDLSIWSELMFLRKKFPSVSPVRLLKLATSSGAKSLGLHDTCGQLREGQPARFTVIELNNDNSDAYAALFSESSAVQGFFVESNRQV